MYKRNRKSLDLRVHKKYKACKLQIMEGENQLLKIVGSILLSNIVMAVKFQVSIQNRFQTTRISKKCYHRMYRRSDGKIKEMRDSKLLDNLQRCLQFFHIYLFVHKNTDNAVSLRFSNFTFCKLDNVIPESLNLFQMDSSVFHQHQSGTYSQQQQHMAPMYRITKVYLLKNRSKCFR